MNELVNIMLKDGVEMPDSEKVSQDLDRAMQKGKIYWIQKDNKTIGFATYREKANRLLMEYCFIYKAFRNKANLLSLRQFFRRIHTNFVWRSRRRNRVCRVT
jgi:hypothetical protein